MFKCRITFLCQRPRRLRASYVFAISDMFSNKKSFSRKATSGDKTVVGNWRFTTVSFFDSGIAFISRFIIEIYGGPYVQNTSESWKHKQIKKTLTDTLKH